MRNFWVVFINNGGKNCERRKYGSPQAVKNKVLGLRFAEIVSIEIWQEDEHGNRLDTSYRQRMLQGMGDEYRQD